MYSPSILFESNPIDVSFVSSMELKLWTSELVNGSVLFRGAKPSSDWINSSISSSLSSKKVSISRPLIWIKKIDSCVVLEIRFGMISCLVRLGFWLAAKEVLTSPPNGFSERSLVVEYAWEGEVG